MAKYQKFLMFGDSITEFAFNSRSRSDYSDQFSLGGALTNAYVRKMDVVQRGFSGYTSRWGIPLLKEILATESGIAVAYIFWGSNDSVSKGHQYVPLQEFVDNVQKQVEMMREAGIRPLIVTPARCDEDLLAITKEDDMKLGVFRSNELYNAYREALLELGEQINVPVVDLYKAFGEAAQWQDLLCDGLHFSGLGYETMYKELMRQLETHYPEFYPPNMEYQYPNWRNVANDGSNL